MKNVPVFINTVSWPWWRRCIAMAWSCLRHPRRQAVFLTRGRSHLRQETVDGLMAEHLGALERLRALETAYARTNAEVCQVLGKALGYPWFKDDQKNFPGATEAGGVCVGGHVAETLADEAAELIRDQAARIQAFVHRGEFVAGSGTVVRETEEAKACSPE